MLGKYYATMLRVNVRAFFHCSIGVCSLMKGTSLERFFPVFAGKEGRVALETLERIPWKESQVRKIVERSNEQVSTIVRSRWWTMSGLPKGHLAANTEHTLYYLYHPVSIVHAI